MNKSEQKAFVNELCNELCDAVKTPILNYIDDDKIPENWDGHELRPYIAGRFAENYCRAAIKNAAAAPDLLAAVRDCRRLLASGERVDDAVIEQIDEIIKHATGD